MKKIILTHLIALLFLLSASAQETITINIESINASDSVIKPHMLGVIAGPAPNYGNSTAPDLTTQYQDVGVTTIRNNDYHDDRLVLDHLQKNAESFTNFLLSLPKEKWEYRYAPGKWTIKEILLHIIDDKRIYAYRALRFARNDATELPGFDEGSVCTVFTSQRPQYRESDRRVFCCPRINDFIV